MSALDINSQNGSQANSENGSQTGSLEDDNHDMDVGHNKNIDEGKGNQDNCPINDDQGDDQDGAQNDGAQNDSPFDSVVNGDGKTNSSSQTTNGKTDGTGRAFHFNFNFQFSD